MMLGPSAFVPSRFLLSGLCLSLLLMGCGSKAEKPRANAPAGAADQQPLTKVKLALNWFPEAEHGGYYAALHHGYYREAGLDVEIIPGGPKVPVLQETALGKVDFAVDNADKLILARAQQANVVGVMAPIQDSPRCVMVHAESGITSLEQLAMQTDYTLAMSPGQPYAQFLSKKLDLSRLRVVPYPGNVSQFLLDPKFAQQAYSFSEPFVAEQQGAKVKSLMVSELGFNTYTSVLVTSGERIERDADLVRRMVAASIRGWQKYFEDPAPTNALIHERNPEMALAVLAYGVADLQRLCFPVAADTTPLGTMTAERWTTLVRQMEESGSIDAGKVPAAEAYRLEFLPAASANEPTK